MQPAENWDAVVTFEGSGKGNPVDYVAGVDLGTSSCKVTTLTQDGVATHATSRTYRINSPRQDWAEQDPESWVGVVQGTLDECLKAAGVASSDDVTVSFTGQMHSLVALNERGDVIRPAILWCDRRAVRQAEAVEEAVPDFTARTGNPALPAFTLPQLMWLREIERS